ncbi:exopolyphosphatase PRUNE1 [Eurytemora carolleeae]|uniref:exopolyphosphatase PRUNE1 n=1 Tax=Eurytemora carolleeae TaxID=1294199 RepID=UPI000C766239|nr:exopolyphosphatase PRUNE1 [Eurytemora carolleeae]|eukprot:XP_023348500.1 exopolyphosphatase PRUNE1-like [Eurytemora affinis]
MIKWVKSLRSELKRPSFLTEEVSVVLGNEACDLDSGVSALVLAFHMQSADLEKPVLPVLNIPSKDYSLKTELVYIIDNLDLSQEDLLFRDSFCLKSLEGLRLVLVDHNILPAEDSELESRVVAVLDHHQQEREETSSVSLKVETVGSCASLVAEKIFSENPDFSDPVALGLLLDAILLDTVGLKPEAHKVTGKDVKMSDRIQSVIGKVDAMARFNELWSAKTRFDHLTPHQLLRRDLKLITTDKVRIGISSVPLLLANFMQLKNCKDDLTLFKKEEDLTVVIVMGYLVTEGVVERDILIQGEEATRDLIATALQHPDSTLGLQADSSHTEFGKYYKQGNTAASRKFILPYVKKLTSSLN